MSESNPNSRLEAFCDGVFAIALTLLIIDIKIPSSVEINSTHDFWMALWKIVPSMVAFVLSFIIILITWVNHHESLKLVNKSSPYFLYSNGLLLLTVVFIPFPTSLIGEYILTDHAAPAVFFYNAIIVAQSVAWVLLSGAAIKNKLAKSEKANSLIHSNRRNGYYSILIYSLLAILAFWFPLAVALITTCTWIFWLVLGINMKHK